MISVLISAAISLRVIGIWPSGGGIAVLGGGGDGDKGQGEPRVIHQYQDCQRRTWCSSSPVNPSPTWNFSSAVQRIPAVLTKAGSETWCGL
jgi:hypothetical protein